jgi:S1-C subfamily serine protease
MPDRVLGDLNALYRQVVQQLKLTSLDNVAGRRPTLVSPYGAACQPGPVSGLPAMLVPPPEWVAGSRSASGVVVATGHVLTSRRVLPEQGEVWIEDPAQPGRRLPATEVASLAGPEVALLRCDGLVVPALAVGERLPDVGGAVAAAARQGEFLAGEKPEVRRGAVVAAADLGGTCVHSAAVARGLGGGPIADESGRLVGLVAATPRTDASGVTRGLGIPIEAIWPLLEEQLGDLQPAVAEPTPPGWEAIEARLAEATVRVIGVEKRVPPPR